MHEPHAVGAEACRDCIGGYPLPCGCGGEVHAEAVYSREGHGRVIVRCSLCGPAYRPWPASGAD